MKTKPAHDRPNAESQRTLGGAASFFGLRWQSKATTPLFRCNVSFQKRRGASLPAALQILAALRLCAFALILLPLCVSATTNDLTSALQKGLFEEEANHNLEAAAQAYRDLSAQFDKDRKVAATAVFRLGEIYRKQGKTNEAVVQYERIVREFSDQETLATLSRQNLASLGEKRRTAISSPITQAARLRQKELLNEEIKLLELDLAELRKQFAAGVVSQTEVRAKEREVLKLRQQVAALDVDVGDETSGVSTETLATDDEEKEIRRIQAMIRSSPDLINSAGEGGVTPLARAASFGWLRVAKYLLENEAAIDGKAQNSTPLHHATAAGHKAMVELLLESGAEVNARDGTGGTALHLAAQKGFLSVAEVLIKHKADLNARNSSNNGEKTPLHVAVENSNAAVIGLLLASGAEVNAKASGGHTPLVSAVTRGQDAVVEQLLKASADVDTFDNSRRTALFSACFFNQPSVVKLLLAAKADPNLVDNQGRTPLSISIGPRSTGFGGFGSQENTKGRHDLVKVLLGDKADPNAGSADSPLLLAVRADDAELAEMLLRAGANPNRDTECDLVDPTAPTPGLPGQPGGRPTRRRGQRGQLTPLQASVLENHPAIVKLLLQFKGDPKANNPDGEPLILDTLNNPGTLKAFLEAGADPNVKNGKGHYALIIAASAGNSTAVDLLLAHGARTDVRDERGFTPLPWAISSDSTNCVVSLLGAGADVNARNNYDWSALHSAVSRGNKAILQMLLEKGANPNVRNNEGKTPLNLAKPDPNVAFATFAAPGSREGSRASAEQLTELLRQHGALDELPFFDRIEVRRSGFSAVAFPISTNGWNEFSLLESLAQHYGFLSTERNAVWDVDKLMPSQFWRKAACQFPDFSRVVIRRPDRSGPRWTEIPVNAVALLDSGDCARDVKLQPGDIVEIPEADHPVNEQWAGLPELQLTNLLHCISRTVTISIKGTPTSLTLSPASKQGPGSMRVLTRGSFMLKSVLAQSRLLRASSDMSRVKVTRRVGDKTQEWVLNCGSGSDPDLWLRDGDVIEVPDKQ